MVESKPNTLAQSHQDPASHGPPSSSVGADIAMLSAVLANEPSDEDADRNLAELLRQLDGADCVARGVESRLDGLLGDLEGLLEGLEAAHASKSKDIGGDRKEEDGNETDAGRTTQTPSAGTAPLEKKTP